MPNEHPCSERIGVIWFQSEGDACRHAGRDSSTMTAAASWRGRVGRAWPPSELSFRPAGKDILR